MNDLSIFARARTGSVDLIYGVAVRVIAFTRDVLKGWWRRALRRGVLFTALDIVDRGYLYLTMKVFDELRSVVVREVIVGILVRLEDALKSLFLRKMETFEVERARSVSDKVVEWGYEAAEDWVRDVGFVRYLTVTVVNC